VILGWISGGRPGIFEILIILIVLIVFFGARRLPELARSLGKSINEFKKGRQEGADSNAGGSEDETGKKENAE
jgi:sec-independent protein translocase protein TatA